MRAELSGRKGHESLAGGLRGHRGPASVPAWPTRKALDEASPLWASIPHSPNAEKWGNYTSHAGLWHDMCKPQAGLEAIGAISLERRA